MFRVKGLGFRVEGLEFRVSGLPRPPRGPLRKSGNQPRGISRRLRLQLRFRLKWTYTGALDTYIRVHDGSSRVLVPLREQAGQGHARP